MSYMIDAEFRFCTFRSGGYTFGVDILLVREVTRHVELTKAPGAPEYVRGLLNLRGQVMTILDLAVILDLPTSARTESTRLLILRNNAELSAKGLNNVQTSDDLVGLWVDSISDVVNVHGSEIRQAPASLKQDGAALNIAGVIQTSDELVRVIDPISILNMNTPAS